ncbi:hypothetical protein SAMN05216196_104305 [Lutimaribacter pacificus]|uniref:Uncharacterized protein n=1 Tax=Lutimaribacter pacificus TaxID=391948 RepID=A0A1H0I9U8_9RHOB|nr:hypothetical protein SAMN05216196_104305 [Lutimaribacter pacificus]SHK24454.1 hypothetical protein SAMN05444142_10480 [Lutimaribacter pacificus]
MAGRVRVVIRPAGPVRAGRACGGMALISLQGGLFLN